MTKPLPRLLPASLLFAAACGWLPILHVWADEDPASPKYQFRYAFKIGEVVRYEVEHAATVRTTIEGTTQTARTNSQSLKAWKVIDVMPDGEIEFAHVVEHVKMRNELPDRAPLEFDSDSGSPPPPGFEAAAEAVGKTLSTIRMTPTGKIVDRQIKHQQPGYSEDTPMVIPLPEEPVAIGHQWHEPHRVSVKRADGSAGHVETRRKFKLEAVTNGVATIAIKYQVLSPIDPPTEAQLVQRLSEGKLYFDLDHGRMTSQQLDVDKRIVGFAGPTSRLHYRMRFTERHSDKSTRVASRPGPN